MELSAYYATYGNGRWNAYISGPWYDDSDIEGRGETQEEAVEEALKKLRELNKTIELFLSEPLVIHGGID